MPDSRARDVTGLSLADVPTVPPSPHNDLVALDEALDAHGLPRNQRVVGADWLAHAFQLGAHLARRARVGLVERQDLDDSLGVQAASGQPGWSPTRLSSYTPFTLRPFWARNGRLRSSSYGEPRRSPWRRRDCARVRGGGPVP